MVQFKEFVTSEKAGKPHYLVAGHPVGHSLSPQMHTIALDYHQIEARYHAVDLLPDDISSFIAWLNRDSFLGANITIPYKREFMQVVDELDKTAESVGALNTLVKKNGIITGFNTDVDGFISPLEPYFDQLEGETVILFGTGGASRAVVYALNQIGVSQVIVVSRNPGRAGLDEVTLCNYENWHAYAEESVLMVNCTPLGMYPNIEDTPVNDKDGQLLEGKLCYDLVYNPIQTKFLKQAEQAGAEIISGLEMFIGQGDRAFELWTGRRFPKENIMQFFKDKLQ